MKSSALAKPTADVAEIRVPTSTCSSSAEAWSKSALLTCRQATESP